MKQNKRQLIFCILLPLMVGLLAAILTSGPMKAFSLVKKPPLTPPGWVFPVVWTILYTLMGIASYLILKSDPSKYETSRALSLYLWQLGVNFLWTIFFFGFSLYQFSFWWLLILWILILLVIYRFAQLSHQAALLLVPYLLWVTFAGYLNFAISRLNG